MENSNIGFTSKENFIYNKSFGYYAIPFIINKNKAFIKHINSIISHSENDVLADRERFKSCRYVFSYIKEIYKSNDFYRIDPDILLNKMGDKSLIDKLFPFESIQEKKRFPATLDEISILIFGKTKGYLLFKVNYNQMTLEQIETFAYYFKRIANSTKNNSTFAQLCCFILGVNDFTHFKTSKNNLTTPFYYLSFPETFVCDTLQLVCHKIEDSNKNRIAHLVCLGRGYGNPQNTTDDYVQNSNYDMQFSPKLNQTWIGSPNTLTCLLESEDFSTKFLTTNIENDYLCLFLTLQNQRHTLLSLTTDMVTFKNNPRKLLKIQEEVNSFKLSESFKTVSNEYSYQNIYEQMYNILDIDNLISDISDISTNAAEQKEKNISKLFKIFTLAASVETLYNIFSVLVPLIVSYIETKEMPENFFTHIGTLSGCLLSIILLSIFFILIPKITKRK